MKLSKLFLMGAIALGLVACNNEEVPDLGKATNATVSLKITQVGTRAVGTNTLATEESNIKKLDVFVFNGDAVDGYKQATSTATVTEVKEIAVTTGSRTIIVVANAPEDLSTITSKATLKAKIAADLADQTLVKGLLMTSEETNAFTIAAGKNYYGYVAGQTPEGTEHSVAAPVKLTRAVARVALVAASTEFTGSYAGWTFEPKEIFLFNAKKQSKYFGASLVQGTELLSGINLTDFAGTLKPSEWNANAAAWTVAYLKDTAPALSAITANAPVYYYTFENDANDTSIKPTVISLKGELKDATGKKLTANDLPGAISADGFTYYSIIVNATKGGYSYTAPAGHEANCKIMRNTQYNISLTIKHPGKNDPTDPPTEAAMLDVKVEVVPWVVVGQSVIY